MMFAKRFTLWNGMTRSKGGDGTPSRTRVVEPINQFFYLPIRTKDGQEKQIKFTFAVLDDGKIQLNVARDQDQELQSLLKGYMEAAEKLVGLWNERAQPKKTKVSIKHIKNKLNIVGNVLPQTLVEPNDPRVFNLLREIEGDNGWYRQYMSLEKEAKKEAKKEVAKEKSAPRSPAVQTETPSKSAATPQTPARSGGIPPKTPLQREDATEGLVPTPPKKSSGRLLGQEGSSGSLNHHFSSAPSQNRIEATPLNTLRGDTLRKRRGAGGRDALSTEPSYDPKLVVGNMDSATRNEWAKKIWQESGRNSLPLGGYRSAILNQFIESNKQPKKNKKQKDDEFPGDAAGAVDKVIDLTAFLVKQGVQESQSLIFAKNLLLTDEQLIADVFAMFTNKLVSCRQVKAYVKAVTEVYSAKIDESTDKTRQAALAEDRPSSLNRWALKKHENVREKVKSEIIEKLNESSNRFSISTEALHTECERLVGFNLNEVISIVREGAKGADGSRIGPPDIFAGKGDLEQNFLHILANRADLDESKGSFESLKNTCWGSFGPGHEEEPFRELFSKKDREGFTPVGRAIQAGNKHFAAELIKYGVLLSEMDKVACREAPREIQAVVRDALEDKALNGLYTALSTGDEDKFAKFKSIILDEGYDVNKPAIEEGEQRVPAIFGLMKITDPKQTVDAKFLRRQEDLASDMMRNMGADVHLVRNGSKNVPADSVLAGIACFTTKITNGDRRFFLEYEDKDKDGKTVFVYVLNHTQFLKETCRVVLDYREAKELSAAIGSHEDDAAFDALKSAPEGFRQRRYDMPTREIYDLTPYREKYILAKRAKRAKALFGEEGARAALGEWMRERWVRERAAALALGYASLDAAVDEKGVPVDPKKWAAINAIADAVMEYTMVTETGRLEYSLDAIQDVTDQVFAKIPETRIQEETVPERLLEADVDILEIIQGLPAERKPKQLSTSNPISTTEHVNRCGYREYAAAVALGYIGEDANLANTWYPDGKNIIREDDWNAVNTVAEAVMKRAIVEGRGASSLEDIQSFTNGVVRTVRKKAELEVEKDLRQESDNRMKEAKKGDLRKKNLPTPKEEITQKIQEKIQLKIQQNIGILIQSVDIADIAKREYAAAVALGYIANSEVLAKTWYPDGKRNIQESHQLRAIHAIADAVMKTTIVGNPKEGISSLEDIQNVTNAMVQAIYIKAKAEITDEQRKERDAVVPREEIVQRIEQEIGSLVQSVNIEAIAKKVKELETSAARHVAATPVSSRDSTPVSISTSSSELESDSEELIPTRNSPSVSVSTSRSASVSTSTPASPVSYSSAPEADEVEGVVLVEDFTIEREKLLSNGTLDLLLREKLYKNEKVNMVPTSNKRMYGKPNSSGKKVLVLDTVEDKDLAPMLSNAMTDPNHHYCDIVIPLHVNGNHFVAVYLKYVGRDEHKYKYNLTFLDPMNDKKGSEVALEGIKARIEGKPLTGKALAAMRNTLANKLKDLETLIEAYQAAFAASTSTALESHSVEAFETLASSLDTLEKKLRGQSKNEELAGLARVTSDETLKGLPDFLFNLIEKGNVERKRLEEELKPANTGVAKVHTGITINKVKNLSAEQQVKGDKKKEGGGLYSCGYHVVESLSALSSFSDEKFEKITELLYRSRYKLQGADKKGRYTLQGADKKGRYTQDSLVEAYTEELNGIQSRLKALAAVPETPKPETKVSAVKELVANLKLNLLVQPRDQAKQPLLLDEADENPKAAPAARVEGQLPQVEIPSEPASTPGNKHTSPPQATPSPTKSPRPVTVETPPTAQSRDNTKLDFLFDALASELIPSAKATGSPSLASTAGQSSEPVQVQRGDFDKLLDELMANQQASQGAAPVQPVAQAVPGSVLEPANPFTPRVAQPIQAPIPPSPTPVVVSPPAPVPQAEPHILTAFDILRERGKAGLLVPAAPPPVPQAEPYVPTAFDILRGWGQAGLLMPAPQSPSPAPGTMLLQVPYQLGMSLLTNPNASVVQASPSQQRQVNLLSSTSPHALGASSPAPALGAVPPTTFYPDTHVPLPPPPGQPGHQK